MTPHHNQQLFSDHYLDVTLPQREDWLALADAQETREALRAITAIFKKYKPGEGEKEAQTEERWVKPVLKALGHVFEVQPSLATPGRAQTPDYVFYRDADALEENKGKTLNEEMLAEKAYAVGDAKSWERALDRAPRTDGKDRDLLSNKNPSYQIAFYMQQSGLDWGILTNGRQWRLYHSSNAHRLDHYYEVDLPALLASEDVGAFLYFYAFFRRAAFEQQPLGVAALLKESVDYARGVSESLKEQVFQALRQVAQGFLDYPDNRLSTSEPETLTAIYDSSLILLYRLLFILYAEARNLLPVQDDPMYRERYSLRALTRDIERDLSRGIEPRRNSTRMYRYLTELFGFINVGDPPLHISTFNGGLFDPRRHGFLEAYTIADARLLQAIDMLARVDGQFIDYRDLSVRNLGTIYEGLLEYHLGQGASEADEEGWTISLLNSKGEQRKATGSFYTPDYIVKYIVDQTLGPVLRETVGRANSDAGKIEAVLATKVLDPSMGSGHFLVEATEYIARFLVELNIQPADATQEADIAYWKRRVVQSCIYGVDLNGLAVELAKLSLWLSTVAKDRPLSFLDHHLRRGNSLIGTRLADLAVAPNGNANGSHGKARKTDGNGEQLSLFQDESFRRSMSGAVDLMWLVESNPAVTVAQVKEQEQMYSQMRGQLTGKYGAIANVYSATRYGLVVDPKLWKPLVDFATDRLSVAPPQFSAWLEEGNVIASTRHFFHWELEFPEVFFDKHGQPGGSRAGFDAVVGNPPWIRQEMFSQDKNALKRYTVYHGVADLSTYFVELGNTFLKEGGRFGFIIPNKFVRANYGGPLRTFLTGQVRLERLVDFGDLPVFQEAVTYPMIVLTSKQPLSAAAETLESLRSLNFTSPTAIAEHTEIPPSSVDPVPFTHLKQLVSDSADLASAIERDATLIARDTLTGDYWSLDEGGVQSILAKMKAVGVPLGQYIDGKVYRGILTGFNEAFVIDRRTRDQLIRADAASAEIIKPFLVGEDIKRYRVDYRDRYLIFTRRGINISDYKAISQYLLQFRTQLEPKPESWIDSIQGNWPGRKPGPYKWYEIQDTVAYYDQFEQPKIIFPDIAKSCSFVFDDAGFYSTNTTYFIPVHDEQRYITALLNSSLIDFFFKKISALIRGDYLRFFTQSVTQIPIPRIENTTLDEERARLVGEAVALYAQNKRREAQELIEAQLASETGRADVARDFLAYLAGRMRDLQIQRREVVGDFRIGLEGALRAKEMEKLNRLWTPPAALAVAPAENEGDGSAKSDTVDDRAAQRRRDEIRRAWQEARDVLGVLATRPLDFDDDIGQLDERQWRWLLRHKFGARSNMDELAHIYRRLHPHVAALEEQLYVTDRLINAIVYRLYGLTPEEVAIVEGR